MALQLFIPPTTSINVLLNNHSTIQINSNNNTLNCYLNVKSPSDWQKCIQNEKLIIDSIDSPPKLKNLDKFKSDHQKNFVRDDRLRSSRGALNSKRDNIKYTSKHPYRKAYNSQLNDINGYSEAYQLDGFGNEDKYGNVLKNAYENFYKDSYRDDYKNVDEEDQLENGSTDPKDRPRLKYRKKIRKKNKINNSHLIISKLSTSLLKETFDSEEDRPIDEAEFENEENDKSHENTDDGHNEDHDENYYKQTNKDRLLSKFDRFDLLNKKFYSTISEDLSPLPVLLKSSTNNIETNQKNQISTSLKPHLNPITLMGNQSTKHKSLLIKEPLENNLNHSFISNKRMRKSKEVANSKLDKRIDSKLNSELDGRLNVEIKKSKKQTNLISPNDKNSRILVRSANDNLDFNYHSMNGPLVYDLLTDQRSNKSFIATNVSRDALKIEQSSAIFNRLLDHRSDYEFKLPSTARLIQRENSEEKIKEKKSLKFDKQSEQSFNDKDPFDREEFANRFKFTTTQSTLDNVHNRTSLSYLSSSSNSSSLSKDSSISSLNSSSDNLLNDKILNTDPLPIEINIKFVLLLIGAVFLSLITMLGNILVMISLIIDRQLRTISNYYLLSLSVADFMIGFISMPLYTLYLLLDRWPLSPLICDTWLALDYLMSNASVLNLLAISVDRYLSVTRPLTYRAKRTTKKALCWIASTWIISSLLWPPWIFYWPHYEGKRTVPKNECYIQFLQSNPYITFITAIAAFYIPVLTMIFLNFRIWRETQQRYRDITTLFLVSTAGKVVKNGNTTKKDFDSQRSTTMTASVGTTNQPSITILSGNNTLTSFDNESSLTLFSMETRNRKYIPS